MALDASIYRAIEQPQAVNPLAQLAQVSQIQGAQQQNRLAALQMQEYERARAEADSQRNVVRGFGADQTANYNALLGSGNLKAAQEYQQANLNQRKTATEAEIAQFKLAHERTSSYLNLVSSAKDEPSYQQALMQAKAMGADVSSAPASYDPKFVANAAAQAQTAQQRVEAAARNRGLDIQALTQQENARHNRVGEGISQGNLGVARANLGLRQQELSAGGRAPAGYRATSDGNLTFIPGGPADPASAKKASPTEFQGKSAIFGARAQESDKILNSLQGSYSPTAINAKQALGSVWGVGGALESGANAFLPANTQRAEQARRDFVNAVLRQESGAAIGKDEFENASRQYFPQPGDSAAVIKQKAENRALQIQGLLGNAGNAPIPRGKTSEGGSTGGWAIEEIK